MSQYFAAARMWLAAIDPALPAAALVIFVFATIYGVRRWWPSAWKVVEATVPFASSLDAGPVFDAVWKTWQFLPGALLGAATAALSSGLSVKSALWGVGSGALASLAHELMAAYKGQVGKPKPPSGPSLAAAGLFAICLTLGGCGLAAVVGPYLAEAAVLIADAVNAVDAAQALLPSLHLSDTEKAKAEAAIGKCRQALAAAAKADDGAKDLTSEQLDASLADFRTAWIDVQVLFASPHIGATAPAYMLPMPLAVKRAER